MRKIVIHNHYAKRARDVKPSFDEWMKQVDRSCEQRSGVSIHDLPDCPFRDWYDSGVSSSSAASRCLRWGNHWGTAKEE